MSSALGKQPPQPKVKQSWSCWKATKRKAEGQKASAPTMSNLGADQNRAAGHYHIYFRNLWETTCWQRQSAWSRQAAARWEHRPVSEWVQLCRFEMNVTTADFLPMWQVWVLKLYPSGKTVFYYFLVRVAETNFIICHITVFQRLITPPVSTGTRVNQAWKKS